MIKFLSEADKYSFLTDIDRLDLSSLISQSSFPEEVNELFISKRKPIVFKLKDFRRSQISKSAWRRNRFSYMSGIHKWRRSFKSKKFNRHLSRLLATKIFEQDFNLSKFDLLKAVSSLRTHLYIENTYYRPLLEDVEFELFLDYAIPKLLELEDLIFRSSEFEFISQIENDTIELLLRVNYEDFLEFLHSEKNIDLEDIESDFENTYKYLNHIKKSLGQDEITIDD